MKKLISLVACTMVVLALSSPAIGQPNRADELYKDGEKQYNLGNFDGAIKAFRAAYEIEDKPAYLYNIAQAYRQLGDCKSAVFFYKRFLSLKANDTVKPLSPSLKAEIEGRITELDACAKDADAIKNRPPDQSLDPTGENGTGTGTGTGTGETGGPGKVVAGGGDGGDDDGEDGDGDVDTGITKPHQFEQPHVLAARLTAGGAKVLAGDLAIPIQFSVALSGGYPIAAGPKLSVEVGVAFTFTPVPYDQPGGETGNASLISALGNVGATYAITPRFDFHGELGAGVLIFSGLDMGNPFTDGGAETTGGLTMFNVRAVAAVEFAVTQNFLLVAPIAFSYSPPKGGLVDDISALSRLDFMLGVGYRM